MGRDMRSMTDVLEIYETLAEPHEGVEVKGRANKYTSMNGNMFSFLDKEGRLCLRLGSDDRAKFGDIPVIQYGAVMKEYVAIPEDILTSNEIQEWFAKSVAYARTLKPKPTKRKTS